MKKGKTKKMKLLISKKRKKANRFEESSAVKIGKAGEKVFRND